MHLYPLPLTSVHYQNWQISILYYCTAPCSKKLSCVDKVHNIWGLTLTFRPPGGDSLSASILITSPDTSIIKLFLDICISKHLREEMTGNSICSSKIILQIFHSGFLIWKVSPWSDSFVCKKVSLPFCLAPIPQSAGSKLLVKIPLIQCIQCTVCSMQYAVCSRGGGGVVCSQLRFLWSLQCPVCIMKCAVLSVQFEMCSVRYAVISILQ